MTATDYTVRLEQVFQGPMDLLLHLVREQEVEIQELEIHRVIQGYMAYLAAPENLDLEFAGEFVVMAATLMAIKSRSLLPRDEVDLEEELSPEDELIERLLEYRRFRESAEALEVRFLERAQLEERGWRGEVRAYDEEPTLDLGKLNAFDLLTEYSRLMRETHADRPHVIVTDPRPLRFYVESVVNRVRRMRKTSLKGLVEEIDGRPTREALVGSFCALLELCKIGLIRVDQPDGGRDIDIELVAEHEGDIEQAIASMGLEDETESEPGSESDGGALDPEPQAD